MKKCLLFLIVFGITFSLWNIKAFAYIVDEENAVWLYGNIIGSNNPDYDRWFLVESQGANGEVILTKNASQTYYYGAVYDASPGIYVADRVSSSYIYYVKSYVLGGGYISYSGSGQPDLEGFDSVEEYEDYINPPPPEPSWWESVGGWLEDYFNSIIELGRIPVDFWEWIWGDDDIEEQPELVIINPPSPTPFPTSIPYSTTINTSTGQIEYHYDISGTPITSTLPPPEPTYQITLPPDAGIAMPSGIYYSDEGLQDVIDAIDDNMAEYSGSIETIRDSFSTLPIKWFAFFGIPAAIMVIAGVIKSLLG